MRVDIELARIVAAFGIVYFHAGLAPGRSVAYGGLIFFVVLACYFARVSTRKQRLLDRAQRLLLPCLFWSAVYIVANGVLGRDLFPQIYSWLSMLLATPSLHLWFLPFIFFALLLCDYLPKRPTVGVVCAVLAVVLITSASLWRSWSFIAPLAQYAHALPAVLMGIFFGAYASIYKPLFWALFFVIIISLFIVIFQNESGVGIPYLSGLIPCLLLLRKHPLLPDNAFIIHLAQTSFGIYLSHILFLMALRFIGVSSYALPCLAFAFAASAVWLFQRYFPPKFTRYIV